jgi:hypothetical protein
MAECFLPEMHEIVKGTKDGTAQRKVSDIFEKPD